MNRSTLRSTDTLSRGDTCPNCGGSLAAFAEPDTMGAGQELRCLMCAHTFSETSLSDVFLGSSDEREPDDSDIEITEPATRLLRELLSSAGADPDQAFRLEKSPAGARVRITKQRSGDIALPKTGNPLLILSRSAARELNGSKIDIDKTGERNRITVDNPGSDGLVKRTA